MKKYSNLNINVIKAYLVHLLTGIGILMSFFSIISILNEDKLLTFLFLIIALFIDVIDGNLARKYNVKKFCPNIDGVMLDSIVDYINYVFIPCIIIYKFNYVPEQFVIILPILILSISLFSFSYLKVMTENYLLKEVLKTNHCFYYLMLNNKNIISRLTFLTRKYIIK